MIEIREDARDHAELARELGDMLDGHAAAVGHPFNRETRCLTAWDGGTCVGGAQYQVNYGWCFLMQLALAPQSRRHGVGSRLINALEERMLDENAAGIWLDTYGFEAAPFYEGHGFHEFGRLAGASPTLDRIFMRKPLEVTS
ncbi:MAG: GNAT family N-acetyltransferase [Pseudomonadota bacterium]